MIYSCNRIIRLNFCVFWICKGLPDFAQKYVKFIYNTYNMISMCYCVYSMLRKACIPVKYMYFPEKWKFHIPNCFINCYNILSLHNSGQSITIVTFYTLCKIVVCLIIFKLNLHKKKRQCIYLLKHTRKDHPALWAKE